MNNNLIEPSQRKTYIDVAKAILIMLIVLGHTESPFTSFLYLFHVAGFILLSGFLFNDISMNFITHLLKRIKGLWVPFVVYSLIFLCLYNIFVMIGIYDMPMITSFEEYVSRIFNILLLGNVSGDMAGALWFVALLFEVSLLYALIHILFSHIKHGEWIKGIVIICMFTCSYLLLKLGYHLPRYIDTTLLILPIFYIGTLYRKYEHKIPMHMSLFLLSFSILLVLNKIGSISLSDKMITNPLFFLVATITGTYAVIYVATLLSKLSIGKVLSYLGKFTFDIMALHFFSFKIVSLVYIAACGISFEYLASFPIIENVGYLWIAYTIVGIIVPIGIKELFSCFRGRLRQYIAIQKKADGGEK